MDFFKICDSQLMNYSFKHFDVLAPPTFTSLPAPMIPTKSLVVILSLSAHTLTCLTTDESVLVIVSCSSTAITNVAWLPLILFYSLRHIYDFQPSQNSSPHVCFISNNTRLRDLWSVLL